MTPTQTLKIISAISGSISGAIAGGVLSVVVEVCMSRYRRRQDLGLDLQNFCSDFYASIAAYWSSSGIDRALELKIISQSAKMRFKAERLVKAKKIKDPTEIQFILKQIHNCATGGNFEGASRTPDNNRSVRAMKLFNTLAEKLKVG